jgi:hypothetical protein
LHEDSYFYTGVVQGANGYREEKNEMPFPVTLDVLKRGQERFNIYCTPCHSRVGNGLGEIVQRGYKPAANLHDQVRLSQPISHYFYVMTHGYGAMPDYSAQLTPVDRWAVAAYIRALAVEPGGQGGGCARGRAGAQPEGDCRRERTPGVCRAVDAARDGDQAYPHDVKQGTPALAPANPADPAIKIPLSKPAARGREVRTNGMAHETHANTHASRRTGRAGLCGRLAEARADCWVGFLGDCRGAGFADGRGFDVTMCCAPGCWA